MKKKELMLDFTSLLDVMLILLFIVIAGMNQASAAAGAEMDKRLSEAEAQVQMLSGEREQLIEELRAMEADRKEYAALSRELSLLEEQYRALADEYDHLKITTNYDGDDVSVYRAALERVTHVVLICESVPDGNAEEQKVKVDIYLGTEREGLQTYVTSVSILHDFALSPEERERLASEQAVDMTKALSAALREDEGKMAWFTVQYAYGDENIANSDIELINRAIENLEHSFDIPCYAEEMKIY